MKKRDLKKAYGNTPTDFHNMVLRTLNSLEEYDTLSVKQTDTKQLSVSPVRRSPLRTAAACALVLALGVGGVISAKALYPMLAQKEGNYGLNIELEPMTASDTTEKQLGLSLNGAASSAPEYVKVSINYLPEGVVSDDESKIKFSLNGEREEKQFTFVTDRVVEQRTFTDANIADFEEFEINGSKAILAHCAVEPFSKRFYIYFEKEAVFIEAFVTGDVTDDEIKKVMENITVEECSEDESDESNAESLTQAKNNIEEEKRQELLDKLYGAFDKDDVYEYSVVDKGQTIYYSESHESSGIELTIDNIEILDGISELDIDKFQDPEEIVEYTDNNGSFIPRTREYYTEGDGITSPFRTLSRTDTVTPKLVYVTLNINNPTSETKEFFYQGFDINSLENAIKAQNGELSAEDPESVTEYADSLNMGEVDYIDTNNVPTDGKKAGYYFLEVPAKSTQTVHIGFLADEDKLDDMYVSIDESWCCNCVFDAALSTFVDNNKVYYHNSAAIKVK